MSNVASYFSLGSGNSRNDIALFGVECEIESVNSDETNWTLFDGIEVKDDPSLRNNGRELVWYGPKPYEQSKQLFKNLHANLKVFSPEQKFSERTSTHVHVNCRGLSTAAVVNLVRMYALYEELVFMCVDKSRRDNIYCVPLVDTHLTALYGSTDLSTLVSRWHKYTAFNLKRLSDLGTVEFRHLQGTDDPELFNNWLLLLEKMFHLAQREIISPDSLTETNVQNWADMLFGHFPFYRFVRSNVPNIVSNSLIDIKLGFI